MKRAPCPRCEKDVAIRKNGEPYAHTKWSPMFCRWVPCLPSVNKPSALSVSSETIAELRALLFPTKGDSE